MSEIANYTNTPFLTLGVIDQQNENAPDSILSLGTLVEQISPKSAPQPPYSLVRCMGMARMGYNPLSSRG